jgi:hypothetical protein
MKKRKLICNGEIRRFPSHEIYLNVDQLASGVYTLNIVHKNKLVKKITFKM